MKINDEIMLKLIKEEYDKRLEYYLGEIEVKAKHSKSDSELVNDAFGLKVKNRAGFLFTIVRISQEEEGKIFAYLAPPGESVDYSVEIGVSSSGDIDSDYDSDNINDDYLVGDQDQEDEEEFIYSSVFEDEEKVSSKENEANSKKMQKLKNDRAKGDIIKPSDKAKFKKQLKIDVDAKDENYEEVDGLIKVTLKELEDNFTL